MKYKINRNNNNDQFFRTILKAKKQEKCGGTRSQALKEQKENKENDRTVE